MDKGLFSLKGLRKVSVCWSNYSTWPSQEELKALPLTYAWRILSRSMLDYSTSDLKPYLNSCVSFLPDKSMCNFKVWKVCSFFNKCAVNHPDSPLYQISWHPFVPFPTKQVPGKNLFSVDAWFSPVQNISQGTEIIYRSCWPTQDELNSIFVDYFPILLYLGIFVILVFLFVWSFMVYFFIIVACLLWKKGERERKNIMFCGWGELEELEYTRGWKNIRQK